MEPLLEGADWLSLFSVRDAAARLPNGEGTRGNSCELLKDSQFLAEGVTDAQVSWGVASASCDCRLLVLYLFKCNFTRWL